MSEPKPFAEELVTLQLQIGHVATAVAEIRKDHGAKLDAIKEDTEALRSTVREQGWRLAAVEVEVTALKEVERERALLEAEERGKAAFQKNLVTAGVGFVSAGGSTVLVLAFVMIMAIVYPEALPWVFLWLAGIPVPPPAP